MTTLFEKTAEELAAQLREAAVDHVAFEKSFPLCDLTQCRATCCHDGVILSEEEFQKLREYGGGEGLTTLTDGRRKTRTVKASAEELAEDFPPHFPGTRCVFLDEQHRCQWQLRAVEEGRHPWYYKPTSCWMHPVLLKKQDGRPLLTVVSREQDEGGFASHTPCGRETAGALPGREALKIELEMLGAISGRDLFGELNAPGW